LSKGLELDPDIEVVDSASDPYMARDKILRYKPDVLTLDVEMPRMDGVEFLRRLMPQHPIPTLMVSTLTERGKQITLDALEAGAVDFVAKPSTDVARGLNQMLSELRAKVKVVARANVDRYLDRSYRPARVTPLTRTALSESTDKVIAIGASTGGTEAIRFVLEHFPADMAGVVIVQHMPGGFTSMFAKSLDQQSTMNVKEAESGDRIMRGRVLIAPGGRHMRVVRSGGLYQVELNDDEKVSGHRPSVDVLFKSVAKSAGSNAIGVLLTGMGHDGADGMVEMRNAGAHTFAQDEASCVVFGMPKVAYERGGTDKLVPLDAIPGKVMSLLAEKS
jgi:two-component system chemotaxis response regulator CheB